MRTHHLASPPAASDVILQHYRDTSFDLGGQGCTRTDVTSYAPRPHSVRSRRSTLLHYNLRLNGGTCKSTVNRQLAVVPVQRCKQKQVPCKPSGNCRDLKSKSIIKYTQAHHAKGIWASRDATACRARRTRFRPNDHISAGELSLYTWVK